MGKKPKSSRKGKKEWRANISTEDIHDFFEKSTKDALSGGSLTSVPSESLFVVDKSTDLSVKRKIEKHREKVLRTDSMLEKNPFVKPVPSSMLKKSKKKLKNVLKQEDAAQDKSVTTTSVMVDLWDDNGDDNCKAKRLISRPSAIPAVEVQQEGCSYNPPHESHQDCLARAVAEEMQKVYQNELGPTPVPLTVPGGIINEEDLNFLEVDEGSDDDMEAMGGDIESEKSGSKTKRVTRVELNKRIRRKGKLKAEAEAKKMEELSKEIDSLPDIIKEIAAEDAEKQRRRTRRDVAKLEKLKVRPPRLGKHKFEPAPVQVLLSEEITGSLRKLKGCCNLAKDRVKSLEKRGLLVPGKSRKK